MLAMHGSILHPFASFWLARGAVFLCLGAFLDDRRDTAIREAQLGYATALADRPETGPSVTPADSSHALIASTGRNRDPSATGAERHAQGLGQ